MIINDDKIYVSSDEISTLLWNDILHNNQASFFQTPEAVSFFKSCGIETFTVAIEKNCELKALVTGVIQKEDGKLKSYFTRRAIIYGGPIFSDNVTSEEISLLLTSLIKVLRNKAIYIEIRNFNNFHEHVSIFKKCNFKYIPHLNFHVNCEDENKIKKNISKNVTCESKIKLLSG